MLSQTPDSNAFEDELGLPRLRQTSDEIGTAMQLERSLEKWEEGLPKELSIHTFDGNNESKAESIRHRQGVLLRLR